MKLAERNKIIADMQHQIEDLRRKSDQGSQQLQGEVQELEIESVLKADFPSDRVEAIQKGRTGDDVVQIVFGPSGIECGKILWESKRTRAWSNEWLAKNRQDQRSSGCQIGVIVSTTMPRNVDTFDRLQGVWVVPMRCMRPLAKALRLGLIEVGLIKSAAKGRHGKMHRLYGYLTGAQFARRCGDIGEGGVGDWVSTQSTAVAAKHTP